MASVLANQSVSELLERLGSVPRERIVEPPTPGTATEADLELQVAHTGRPCELVDGVLVEKGMGFHESCLAALLIHALIEYLRAHPLGIVSGEAGTLRLAPGLVRAPDVCFISWDRLPGRRRPTAPLPDLSPDLAVEILSRSNTAAEMERKLREYFSAGTHLVWIVDPRTRSACAYSSPSQFLQIDDRGALEGGDVLPGFHFPLGPWLDAATAGAPE